MHAEIHKCGVTTQKFVQRNIIHAKAQRRYCIEVTFNPGSFCKIDDILCAYFLKICAVIVFFDSANACLRLSHSPVPRSPPAFGGDQVRPPASLNVGEMS